jgi:hypothetical protein
VVLLPSVLGTDGPPRCSHICSRMHSRPADEALRCRSMPPKKHPQVMSTSGAGARQDLRRFAWNDLNVPRLPRWARAQRRPRFGVLAIALVVAVLGAGCSDGEEDEGATATTTSTTTETTTTSADDAQITAAIAAFEDAALSAIRAGMIPDPNHPDLERTHTDPVLTQTREALRSYQLRHIAFSYPDPPESGFRVMVDPVDVVLTEDTAVFDACAVDDGERVNTETGEFMSSNDGPDTVLVRIGMRLENGVWKLAERRELDSWRGVAGCAA